ncbi:MAG: AzlD domain-containing protein, partial [Eubacteriales bacterium]|nr:AzlD domain-containing protein [Eubacteriales bacterium]
MTFPAILSATASVWSALAAFVAAIALAYYGAGLFKVSVGACLIVIVFELLL